MGWLAAAWPLGLVYFVGGVVVAARRFGPRSALWVDQRVIEAQLRTLGTITRQEILGLVGLALILLAFVLQPWSRMDPAWLGLITWSLLALSGADPHRCSRSLITSTAVLCFVSIDRGDDTRGRTRHPDRGPHRAGTLARTSLGPPYLLLGSYAVISYLIALLPGFPPSRC